MSISCHSSSYADLMGGIGMLFEQASSRGHLQENQFGKLTFPFTILNHCFKHEYN